MPYYEIVYETGNHSIAEYADDEEASNALQAHHDKAKTGQSATPESQTRTDLGDAPVAGPTSWPAERIAKVYKYDKHPADLGSDNKVNAETLHDTIDALKNEEGLVDTGAASSVVRNASSPFMQAEGPFDSDYAMPHEEVTLVSEGGE